MCVCMCVRHSKIVAEHNLQMIVTMILLLIVTVTVTVMVTVTPDNTTTHRLDGPTRREKVKIREPIILQTKRNHY